MSFQLWMIFVLVTTLASISPGPNVLIVAVNAYSYGTRGAFFTILGNLLCLFCIALLAAIGVGSLLATLPMAYMIMKIAGGIYLIYLGVKIILKTITAKSSDTQILLEEGKEIRSRISFMTEAFLVSASNPKSIIFLSSVFPQFISTSEALIPQFMLMFISIICIVCIIHGSYAFIAVRLKKNKLRLKTSRWISRLTGGIFIGLGGALAFSK